MTTWQFNIRVYGILINDANEVLITDEFIKGNQMTKFPGGGLEFGEGMIDCVKREFMEELNMKIEIAAHFYTTDFFQPSAFRKNEQIISVYYLVKSLYDMDVQVKEKVFDFERKKEHEQQFRWLHLDKISEADFTLPIDKIVGGMLKEKNSADKAKQS